jgi:hypothetical protein
MSHRDDRRLCACMVDSATDLTWDAVVEGKSAEVDKCGQGTVRNLRLLLYELSIVTFEADAEEGFVWSVLTDPDTRGWHAYVNGKEVRLFRATGYVRAVCIPDGHNHLVFRFEPFWEG